MLWASDIGQLYSWDISVGRHCFFGHVVSVGHRTTLQFLTPCVCKYHSSAKIFLTSNSCLSIFQSFVLKLVSSWLRCWLVLSKSALANLSCDRAPPQQTRAHDFYDYHSQARYHEGWIIIKSKMYDTSFCSWNLTCRHCHTLSILRRCSM